MPCYHPLKGWRRRNGGITWKRAEAYVDLEASVACGQCIGCRLERSRQWAVRLVHEASLHDESCFTTLTYDDDHLPEGGSLKLSDFQKFMKRLRKHVAPKKVRFFHCGEYGEQLERPHYHACLFGYDPPDKYAHELRGDHAIQRSPTLERLWPCGHVGVGNITFESAAYVARYVTKKVNGRAASDHYGSRAPEYSTMSRRPGIGQGWIEKYHPEVYPSDEVIMRGRQMLPPRYYDQHLERENSPLHAEIKAARARGRDYWNESEDRLAVRETVARSRLSTFSRRPME